MNLCTIHQWIWNCAFEEGGSLPWLTRRHLQRCAGCREAVESLQQVSARLAIEQVEIDESWHVGVMQEIRRAARPAPPSPAIWALPVSLAALLAICVAVLLVRQQPPLERGDEVTTRQVAPSFVLAVGDVAGALENEGTALQQDLQQALQIATACLPF